MGLENGADISMLPELERAGAKYTTADGEPSDAITVLRQHGCDLFRLRLFVHPSQDFNATYGAVQDLASMRDLALRVKKAGGRVLLDLHYSDTWADPQHQRKPAAWRDLDFAALEEQVTRYTREVLLDLGTAGATPDMVQVGNEITSGILFPDGQVHDVPEQQKQQQWRQLARLLSEGIRGVRSVTPSGKHIPVMLHIHGGGKPGVPEYFFSHLDADSLDFDCIGLSFYPAWGDDIDALRQNLRQLAARYRKKIYLIETSYPWRPLKEAAAYPAAMRWTMSPEGQVQFLSDLTNILNEVPDGLGAGWNWWYPEAIPVPGRFIWRGGAEALFDAGGRPLPAMRLMSSPTPAR